MFALRSQGILLKDTTELQRVKFVIKGGKIIRNELKGAVANLSRR
jgi:hypothetical protein